MTLIRGLEGVIASTSSVSSIIDDTLTYVGYPIDELVEHATFEEIVYLLWNGKLPNADELAGLTAELAAHAALPSEIIDFLKAANLSGHPMGVLRTVVSMLALYDEEAEAMTKEANYRKAIRLQARIATAVTAFARIRKGLDPVGPDASLGYAANFLYMLNGTKPEPIAEEAFNKALVLHADHELNASTFTARVCVATLSDIYSGVTSAIGALKGPLHGGANEQVMRMLLDIGDVANVEPYVLNLINNKAKIMGFGHRVYRNGDPRAKHLRAMSQHLCTLTGQTKYFEMSVQIEEIMKETKNIPPNVDFYSASMYHCLGIEYDLFTPIFAVSRVSGWVAHILEQYENNRIIRPRAEYVGPQLQTYVPVSARA
ncbi:MAG: citrate synthase [Bacilli bacterium]